MKFCATKTMGKAFVKKMVKFDHVYYSTGTYLKKIKVCMNCGSNNKNFHRDSKIAISLYHLEIGNKRVFSSYSLKYLNTWNT